ncbi:MAG: alpha/beta fold hydrolase [Cellvibrionaceae bacterium]
MTNQLFHRQWGDDGPPVVMIHGLFGSIENLGMITRLLKDEYKVYALDLPNHGRSPHTDNTSLAMMAEAIIAWMDTAGLDEATFLGHSLGGKVSMEIALRYPDRVSRLIVADIAPVTYPRRHDDVFTAFQAVDLNAISNRTDADEAMKPHVTEFSTRSFLLKNLERKNDQWQWRINLIGLTENYDSFIVGNTVDYPTYNKPVLFIKGELSSYILPEHRESILSLFPNAAVKVINGTEHWLHAEKPDIFTGIVKRFLAS